jgi:hypothetical protein
MSVAQRLFGAVACGRTHYHTATLLTLLGLGTLLHLQAIIEAANAPTALDRDQLLHAFKLQPD